MVIKISIQSQCEMLRSRFKMEFLTSSVSNKTAIQTFCSRKSGKGLECYLKENAWDEDQRGVTKVYLVKDIETDDIVFYFALSAGLLYKEIGAEDNKLSDVEKEIVNYCIDVFLNGDAETTADEVFSWYEGEPIDKIKLQRIIDSRIKLKMAALEDPEKTESSVNVRHVSETFPGIVLTHFCKNENYSFTEELAFPIGFYIFWEIVTKEVLHISSLLGCQYLYLFAADNTVQEIPDRAIMYSEYWDDDEPKAATVYKLVEYYKNELKFEELQEVTILKPYYDFPCFSLIQPIDQLEAHRNAAWIQHADVV